MFRIKAIKIVLPLQKQILSKPQSGERSIRKGPNGLRQWRAVDVTVAVPSG